MKYKYKITIEFMCLLYFVEKTRYEIKTNSKKTQKRI